MQNDRTKHDLENARRQLMALREKHGPDTAIGHHVSNLVELFDQRKLPRHLIQRQLDGLQRAMRDVQ